MSKTVRPIIEALFTTAVPARQPVNFSWRLIPRKGRPFMLLPPGLAAARTGLNLYSAQRWPAKLWRTLLPWLLQTPAAKIFERIQFEADAASEIMQFIAQQTGVPAKASSLSAIKISEVGRRSRLVLLLCDESGRPARVIKASLNAAGQEATNLEADFLEKLPANTIGCIRLTDRINHPSFSAFATDYFPGESPRDDVGMEQLFHAWLNPATSVPLESLPTWQELDASATQADPDNWRVLKKSFAGKTVRPTLYHGDFAPWNVRAVNSQNLRAFDWERGQLRGIPGWDWFHFIIQTAILARRHSTERAAAEVEQLIHSERFKKYAAAAGIGEIVQPLLLAYLLHHRLVIKPMEGRRATGELFNFLAARWQISAADTCDTSTQTVSAPASDLWASVRFQLQSAADQWSNLFWEPTLNSTIPPSLGAQLRAHWRVIFLAGLLFTSIATAQFYSSTHLVFLPFYMVACAWLTWRVDRRWGALAAAVAAVLGPLVLGVRDTGLRQLEIVLWNTVMRLIILQMCVLFVDRIHRQKDFFRRRATPNHQPVAPGDNWIVVLLSSLLLILVIGIDIITGPQMNLLPLYLFPCMVLTLVLNLRWGIVTALLATSAGALSEYFTTNHDNYPPSEIFLWNFLMRLAVLLVVIILLDRIRKENILFFQRKTNGH